MLLLFKDKRMLIVNFPIYKYIYGGKDAAMTNQIVRISPKPPFWRLLLIVWVETCTIVASQRSFCSALAVLQSPHTTEQMGPAAGLLHTCRSLKETTEEKYKTSHRPKE